MVAAGTLLFSKMQTKSVLKLGTRLRVVGSVPKAFESALPLNVVASTTVGWKVEKAESYWSRKNVFVSPLQIAILSFLRLTGICCDEGKIAFNPDIISDISDVFDISENVLNSFSTLIPCFSPARLHTV